MDHDNVVKNAPNLVQPISQPNLAQWVLCWKFDDQKDMYLPLRGVSVIQKGHFYGAEPVLTIRDIMTQYKP